MRAATVAVVDEAGGGHEEGAVVVVARALAVELAGAEVDVLRKQKKKKSVKKCARRLPVQQDVPCNPRQVQAPVFRDRDFDNMC